MKTVLKKGLIAFALPSVTGIGGWGNGYVAVPKGHYLFEKIMITIFSMQFKFMGVLHGRMDI